MIRTASSTASCVSRLSLCRITSYNVCYTKLLRALLAARYSRMTAFLVGVATGLVEPIGGLVGAVAVAATPPAMPLALGFAAGSYNFV